MDDHVWLAESVVEQHPLRIPATLATADNVAATGRSTGRKQAFTHRR